MEPQTSQNNSIVEKIETAQALTGLVATSAVTPFRRRVGLRMTRGIFLYPVVALMAAIGYFGSSSHWLCYYAGAVLGAGLWQNYHRWQEMKRGELTHTRSLGVSPLASLPFARLLPAKLTHWIEGGDHIHRSLDPLLMFAAGLVIVPHDQALGGWVMFSAVSLRIFEEFKHEAGWNQLFEGMDAMLNGETQKAFMDHIRRGNTEPLTDPATGRQTTGAAEELAERIARNKAQQAAAAAEDGADGGQQAHEQAQRPHPFTEAVNRVKEGAGAVKDSAEAIKESAGAVKEAAEAVSAVRDATAPPAADTVIIDRVHYVPFPVEPDAVLLTSGPAKQWDALQERYRNVLPEETEAARLNAARETWDLPAPPKEGAPPKAT